MRGGDAKGRNWVELARCRAPVDVRLLWEAILDKTEHPERYDAALRRAELLDHDAQLVCRRTVPCAGRPYIEWVEHARRVARVETRRRGQAWRRAQAVVDGPGGPWLVYEVDDLEAAASTGEADPARARRILERLLESARDHAADAPPAPPPQVRMGQG
jgi:hypothetical protein